MELFSRRREEEYLERTSDTAEREATFEIGEKQKLLQETLEPFTQEQWQEQGSMVFDMPGAKEGESSRCTIEYAPVEGDPTKRLIKKFRMEEGENVLDSSNFPEGFPLFFSTTPLKYKKGETMGVTHKDSIEVFADLRTPLGIYTLLHEVGHAFTDTKQTDMQKEDLQVAKSKLRKNEPVTVREKYLFIKDERSADAFVLLNLRKFLSKEQLDVIKKVRIYSDQKQIHRGFLNCQTRQEGFFERMISILAKE